MRNAKATIRNLALGLGLLGIISLAGEAVAAPEKPQFSCNGLQATVVGTDGSDLLSSQEGVSDIVVALSGDDVVQAQGEDTVCAGSGDDDIRGAAKWTEGGSGSDRMEADGKSPANFYGGDGDDLLVGSRAGQRDYLYGGSGDDRVFGRGGREYMRGGSGDDHLVGGAGGDVAWGGDGIDFCLAREVHNCE
ncbi:MAG: hypothetical protein M3355_04545 [Actinomycetota bacterium]|nr:hypothetical protein [Actinomycetota bacterium]